MKKLICSILIVLMLFNFILCSNKAYADEITNSTKVTYNSTKGEELDAADDPEKKENTGNGMSMGLLGSVLGAITGILAWVLNLLPELVQAVMKSTTELDQFTIKAVIFNEVPLFDINYFDLSTVDATVGTGKGQITENQNTVNILRLNVAKWYYITKLIATSASLLVLIYVGIRMALSTIASDKTKYKQMLIYWFESIMILFFMQYILSFIFTTGNAFTDLFAQWEEELSNNSSNFELTTMDTIYGKLKNVSGWEYTLYSIVFWFLIGLQFKFYANYFRRLVTVGFLIIISPLVTVVYAIDKVGDQNAQSFKVLLMEFMINVIIQPIHAIIYLIFMFTAGEIAQKSILISLIFMLFITKVEKFILHLFDLRNVVSLRAVNEEQGLKI